MSFNFTGYLKEHDVRITFPQFRSVQAQLRQLHDLDEALEKQRKRLRRLKQKAKKSAVEDLRAERARTALFQGRLSQLFGTFQSMKHDFVKLRKKG